MSVLDCILLADVIMNVDVANSALVQVYFAFKLNKYVAPSFLSNIKRAKEQNFVGRRVFSLFRSK